ncbi:Transcription elongation factor GreB [Sphingomonas antarctica]|uniref:GreA/GreB family elongation factor n=1 Tax=Sphingomonas antarctica TaxID=2040274 RepID=UPI0039EB6E88
MTPIQPITAAGFAALRTEYEQLMSVERPAIVEIVSWAAGNGDRSENGDYIYGRQKLRAIDRRAGFLAKRMKAVTIVKPGEGERDAVRFGATVIVADDDDLERRLTIVGDDEAEAGQGRIGWGSPLARALRGARVGDVRTVNLPGGEKNWEVIEIAYE